MTRISEAELLLPTLHLLFYKDFMTTSELINSLRVLLNPSGEDLEILSGRKDDKFSQKVRNLKAHNSLTRDGLVEEAVITKNKQTTFTITQKGKSFYLDRKHILDSLLLFPLKKTKKILSDALTNNINILIEDVNITEGQIIEKQGLQKTRKRSLLLRNTAVEAFTKNGIIKCEACSFEFNKAYGIIGKGYIEIHHITPICEYENHTIKLEEAIKNVAPLCANCHRVIHIHKPFLSVEEVSRSVNKQKGF